MKLERMKLIQPKRLAKAGITVSFSEMVLLNSSYKIEMNAEKSMRGIKQHLTNGETNN